jgi:1-acyl-sn-glycerol-3-phosphate acyltransferase
VGDLVYRGVIAVSRAAFRGLGLRIELRGDEHLLTTGGAVLASNHVSFLDFLFVGLVGVQRGRLVRFLAKESIFRLPVVGWAMRRMRHISVDRAHGTAALRRAVRVAAAGEVVGIFPEATFSRNGALLPLRPGAAAIAVWDQVPLVPVAVWGGQNVLSVRPWRFRLRRGVTVVVGEPLRPGLHADPVAVTDVLRARVGDLLRETAQTLDPEPSRAR